MSKLIAVLSLIILAVYSCGDKQSITNITYVDGYYSCVGVWVCPNQKDHFDRLNSWYTTYDSLGRADSEIVNRYQRDTSVDTLIFNSDLSWQFKRFHHEIDSVVHIKHGNSITCLNVIWMDTMSGKHYVQNGSNIKAFIQINCMPQLYKEGTMYDSTTMVVENSSFIKQ